MILLLDLPTRSYYAVTVVDEFIKRPPPTSPSRQHTPSLCLLNTEDYRNLTILSDKNDCLFLGFYLYDTHRRQKEKWYNYIKELYYKVLFRKCSIPNIDTKNWYVQVNAPAIHPLTTCNTFLCFCKRRPAVYR